MAIWRSAAKFSRRFPFWPVYIATVVVFMATCVRYYLPGQGFTCLIVCGDRLSGRYLPELREMPHFEEPDSWGYDGQFYVQFAMHPSLGEPAMRKAVDNLTYRARRILFSWTAYVLGGGDPNRVVLVFSLQNIACWLLLAGVLLRWFPADSWENLVRWLVVLFSFGVCFSLRRALLEGPSLLLVAVGVMLLERGRTWWAAAVLGVNGLGRETNVLAGGIFLPDSWRDGGAWRRAIGHAVLVVGPLLAWLVILRLWVGGGIDVGTHNFQWPFAGYIHQWRAAWARMGDAHAAPLGWRIMLTLTALSVQWLAFVGRPQWQSVWWRVGIAYAALMMVLGDAVWEGYPSATTRVVLPMMLAFNVTVPRKSWRWFGVLLLGNLSVILSPEMLRPPDRPVLAVSGSNELRSELEGGGAFVVEFGEHWDAPENSWLESWRWSDGDAAVTLHNPHAFALTADVSFRLRANDARQVRVVTNGTALASVALQPRQPHDVTLKDLRLPPGDTPWTFVTDRPAAFPPDRHERRVAFSLRNLTIRLRERAPPTPGK